ncbi:MAG: DUF2961 domain-containing protein [bacterium]|nr:DUF2961 domain-containing protein [bacterium]
MRPYPAAAFAWVTLACLLGTSHAQEVPLRFGELLGRMAEHDWLWRAPAVGERCIQFSSFDRRSAAGPDDADAWYANDDRGNYLRVEEREGREEHVMVDVEGAGLLTRIWSANPSGELFFYLDGELTWTVDFGELCSGRLPGVPEPLAGVRARGANCYLPMPFARSLKVTASAGDCYYQCNVTTLPAASAVESFDPKMLSAHADELAKFGERLAYAGPRFRSDVDRGVHRRLVRRGRLVREFGVWFHDVPEDADLGELLRQVLLVVRCGDEETVRVPLPDFFCAGADWRPWRSRYLQVSRTEAGCAWPMPMPDGGSIGLEIEGDLQGMTVGLRRLTQVPLRERDPLLFRASYHQRTKFSSRPFGDHLVLDAKGTGRFVGCSLLVKNPTRGWWGEGDEKFYVDGEAFPSTFGTGTEDYFGYAWCSPELFSSPFHAQVQCDGPGNYGFTALHRTHVLDSVPFQRSMRFDLEVWHWVEGLALDYASVAYWYGAPGARSGLPAVPPAVERRLERLPPPPVFVADGVVEGESLRVVACTGGEHEVQDMSHYEQQFSQDGQRWWKHGERGDTLVLAVPVPEAGRYRVLGAFCRANDYGIVQLTLADQKLGGEFDAYHGRVASTGKKELGVVELAAGEAMLRVTILGKHDKAHPAHMFGLDYLELQKLL